MQQPIEHAIQQPQQEDVVREAHNKMEENCTQIAKGENATLLHLDTLLPMLQDQSVG